jgi:DNA-binding MarR family transcriptional regulator
MSRMIAARWKGHDELVLAWMRSIVLDAELDSTEKLVALSLGTLVCGRFRATHYPIRDDISAASGVTTRTVSRVMPVLERQGFISRRCLGDGPSWRRTIYRLRAKKAAT